MALIDPLAGGIQAYEEAWQGTPKFRVTSTYAQHVASGRGTGTDIGNGRQGDPIYAVDAGQVTQRYIDPGNGALIVRHTHRLGSGHVGYAHLSSAVVGVGQSVAQGQLIGYTGMSGASAPHLHIGLNLNGAEVDIWPYLPSSKGEPMSETIVTLDRYPEGPRKWYAAGGSTVGYLPDGSTKTVQLNPGSWANADGTAVITQDPQKAPNGSGFVHIIDGTLAGYYLVPTAGTVEPPPEPPPAGDYSEGYADGAANTQLAWQGWLEARPVGELEAWAGTAPQTPPPVGRRGLRDRISEDEPQAVALE